MIVYDIEIINAVPDSKKANLAGINYCQGWDDKEGMGISVIGAYDYSEERYRVFCEDNLVDFTALVSKTDVLVGFNSINFDNQVLAANGIEVPDEINYDLLREIWKGAGLDPDAYKPRSHGSFGLSNVASVNLGVRKSGEGALAPVQWQRGQIGNVIDYCLMDVKLTKQLLDLVLRNGRLLSPATHAFIDVRRPR